MNYYKDLWTTKDGSQFFKNVDFNHKDYKHQEQVFRQFLKGLKRLKEVNMDQKPIETVLEVGAGTGRITKIMLEEFPDIFRYDVTDLQFDRLTLAETIGPDNVRKLNWYSLDITSDEFNLVFAPHSPIKTYDIILSSEVFMHIKPEDIGSVLKRVTGLLAPNHGLIANIDWGSSPEPSEWCFIHDYDKMYIENGLHPVFEATINKQKLFCYGK